MARGRYRSWKSVWRASVVARGNQYALRGNQYALRLKAPPARPYPEVAKTLGDLEQSREVLEAVNSLARAWRARMHLHQPLSLEGADGVCAPSVRRRLERREGANRKRGWQGDARAHDFVWVCLRVALCALRGVQARFRRLPSGRQRHRTVRKALLNVAPAWKSDVVTFVVGVALPLPYLLRIRVRCCCFALVCCSLLGFGVGVHDILIAAGGKGAFCRKVAQDRILEPSSRCCKWCLACAQVLGCWSVRVWPPWG